jgi:hypothetical protein
VEKFVRDEQRCCAFLRFDLAQKDDGVHLLIAAPNEAAQAADIHSTSFAAYPGAGRRQTKSISISASYARPVTPTQVRAGKRFCGK